jgi:hypothetical protein
MYTIENDPELNGKYLGTITRDFALVSETLKEASYQIRKRGFSDFPIFPVSKDQLPLGLTLIAKGEMENQWNYHAAYLDEFVQRKIIGEDKKAEFESVYKNPDEFCCLFVVDGAFTNFLFIPYPED